MHIRFAFPFLSPLLLLLLFSLLRLLLLLLLYLEAGHLALLHRFRRRLPTLLSDSVL